MPKRSVRIRETIVAQVDLLKVWQRAAKMVQS